MRTRRVVWGSDCDWSTIFSFQIQTLSNVLQFSNSPTSHQVSNSRNSMRAPRIAFQIRDDEWDKTSLLERRMVCTDIMRSQRINAPEPQRERSVSSLPEIKSQLLAGVQMQEKSLETVISGAIEVMAVRNDGRGG